MNAGDVVWVQFPGVVQTKRRPAVVLSSAAYHASRPDVIVGLITSQTTKSTAPTDYVLHDWGAARLRLPSAFRAFIVTLPRSAVFVVAGSLSPRDRAEVAACVRRAVELA